MLKNREVWRAYVKGTVSTEVKEERGVRYLNKVIWNTKEQNCKEDYEEEKYNREEQNLII